MEPAILELPSLSDCYCGAFQPFLNEIQRILLVTNVKCRARDINLGQPPSERRRSFVLKILTAKSSGYWQPTNETNRADPAKRKAAKSAASKVGPWGGSIPRV